MSCMVKLDVGQFPKHRGINESITFVTPKGLNMKNIFS
jgi:hypothetical protein